jgi:adenosylmethionine-8-amino-7-oxononanoate aminotransferase
VQHKKFAKELVKIKNCQNVRQCGTILAFDVVTHENTHYFNNIRDKLYQLFIDKKIIIRPLGNTIYILPPYCISNKQLSLVYQAIIDIILIL